MDGGLIIAIGKRAKEIEKKAGGYASDGDESGSEESESDVDAVMEDAAADVAKALGVDPETVDLSALAGALCDLMDAHALKGEGAKKAAVKKG